MSQLRQPHLSLISLEQLLLELGLMQKRRLNTERKVEQILQWPLRGLLFRTAPEICKASVLWFTKLFGTFKMTHTLKIRLLSLYCISNIYFKLLKHFIQKSYFLKIDISMKGEPLASKTKIMILQVRIIESIV